MNDTVNEMNMLNRLREEVSLEHDLRSEETRLLAAIRGGTQAATTPFRPAHRVRRLRLGMALAGALALAAMATATVVNLNGAGSPSLPDGTRQYASQSLDPATVLENAALVAEKSTRPPVRPDQWFYVKETQEAPLPTFEHWSRLDGTLDAIREDGRELKVGEAEKGSTYPLKTQAEIEDFPDDPDALLEHLRNLKQKRYALSICQPNCPPGTEEDVAAYGAIQWYMKYGPLIPPEKAAAMYRAMAKIPNVTIEQNATTGEGRKGIGIVLDLGEAGKGYTILDPDDYHYLGVKVVDDGKTFAMSVLDSGIVDKPGEIPS